MRIFKSRFAVVLAMALGLALGMSGAVHADAADKATVDAAKAQGIVGEQGDGYLGIRGNASPDVSKAVASINAGRAQVYAQTAAKTGTSPAAAGEASAQQIFAAMPSGHYYKPPGSTVWQQK